MMILGIWFNSNKKVVPRLNGRKQQIVVSEFPFPNAIRVPNYLSYVLPMDRSMDKLLENMGGDKLKFFRKHRENYRIEKIVDVDEIGNTDKTMLRPFAIHRYGEWALHFSLRKLKKIAFGKGALNLVFLDEEKVACSLASETVRAGKHYWRGERAGFPEAVFTQSKAFNVINSMNYYLEIEWAAIHGYDYYECGVSLACPDDNVLQWKRRLRGHLDTMGNFNYFYLSPPKSRASEFFWDAPLFGLEQGKMVLHLGKPCDKSDEDFIKRYRAMGFGGLYVVYLHCRSKPSEEICAAVADLYTPFKSQPTIEIKYEEKTAEGRTE